MKRWFLLAVVTTALPVIALACGDDSSPGGATPGVDAGKTQPTTTSTTTNTIPTTTSTAPVDAGPDAARRTGCLDRPTDVDAPNRLPCNLIPPGLTL